MGDVEYLLVLTDKLITHSLRCMRTSITMHDGGWVLQKVSPFLPQRLSQTVFQQRAIVLCSDGLL